MFDPAPGPRLFGLAPGIDFPRALVAGLRARLAGHPPEAMARVELFVSSDRMRRRVETLFAEGPPGFLPRIRLVTQIGPPALAATLPDPAPGLRRRLELTALVSRLIDADPAIAPRAALFDLADSLAQLMDEMQVEDVPPDRIAGLDVTDLSGHWARALRFLTIVQRYFDADAAPDAAALQRRMLELRLADWQAAPPDHPVIVAGSTGSRGTTLRLMQAVAHLPQGALVLPGFDTDLPRHVWDQLTDTLPQENRAQPGEDHPQFRFARLLSVLGSSPRDVLPWTEDAAPAPARNRLVSLALRPAPVTDQWLRDGPALPPLEAAMAEVTLLEAPTRRDEARTIALRLRQAAEDGTPAALVTPDRMLTRQVAAALGRWGIVPDDSAGTPLQLTPPGRLMRQLAALFAEPLTAEALLAILKHPLTHAGAGRGPHQLDTQRLELFIRRRGMPYPDEPGLAAWRAEEGRRGRDPAIWSDWLRATFTARATSGRRPLADWVADHVALGEAAVAGSAGGDATPLWDESAGRTLRGVISELTAEAGHGTDLSARDYADLFAALLSRAEAVRDRDAPHPLVRIWGTIEARVMGADLLILGGLNDGTWPEMPAADPWLNRRMRAEAGLTLPERRIGLSAHDFQQAIAAREVWLTRAERSDDAETVPSRWLNRIVNLLSGLPARQGPEALAAMRARGTRWRQMAAALETPIESPRAPRPSPAPPAEARPTRLSVTRIKTLIRDPYAIYAREVLRLRPLDPLQAAPDALMRGNAMHDALEAYVTATLDDPAALSVPQFMAHVDAALAAIPFPTIRHLWRARMARIAEGFVADEIRRRAVASPHRDRLEIEGRADLAVPPFTLTAKADRIDLDARGVAWIYDYKTGTPPSKDEQAHFDKQLLLEAAMAERGGFAGLAALKVAHAAYIGVGPKPGELAAPLDEVPPAQVWEEFGRLMARYADAEQGYTARRALQSDAARTDYDHLSRLGEWEVTDRPVKERLR
ncbi:double-strand break repair protein AddB [Roseivivax isoporae]|uniref:Helicase n=1 Tax=Roseivivax isoporae LMG 25204 TaxID=1449351 RepID=X7F529_9RHOB|nr:double-strand break repair protein AddB [Roseivivax isoporae]ETX27910.1 helicase [Roseivivax isoporae LMG 25204]